MTEDNKTIPFPAEEKDKAVESPWLFRFWRIAVARKTKNGNPAVRWASGYVALSDRVFWKHKIKPGDVVQIRAKWDDNYTGVYAYVEKVFLENADLTTCQPAKGGAQMLRMRNIPVGALMRVGKAPAKIGANRRRNPNKMLGKK